MSATADDTPPPEPSRRDVLRLAAATLGAAALAGCEEPPGDVLPYVMEPEELVPGRPRFYATAVTLDGFAQPVLAETHMGRPTRLDGNPRHPLVQGRIDVFAQAAVLGLYDPDRSRHPWRAGERTAWPAWETALSERAARWRSDRGAGLRLLTGALTSPTLLRQVAAFNQLYPAARWHAFEPVGPFDAQEAARLAFGRPLDLVTRIDRAAAVVAVGADPLGPGPAQVPNARGWSARRAAARAGDAPFSLLVAEATPTLTGLAANRRQPVDAARLPALLRALAAALGLAEGNAAAPGLAMASDLPMVERAWVAEAADRLRDHAGHSLLLAGPSLPADARALALTVNARLGNLGATLIPVEPMAPPPPDGSASLATLARDMTAGRVGDLLILGANPAHTAPADLDFAAALARVPFSVHMGLHRDETALGCLWHLPLAHELEGWGDARAVDGTATILQPLVRPIYDGRPAAALVAACLGRPDATDESEVRATWTGLWTAEDVDARWRESLRNGFVRDSAPATVDASPQPLAGAADTAENATADPGAGGAADGVAVLLQPDARLWDGRFANLGWLQELPDPLTKLSWDAAALIAPELAARLGVTTGDRITLEVGGARLDAPAWVLPGQAPRTVTLSLGHARTAAGTLPRGVGYDAYRLRRSDAPWLRTGATAARGADGAALAATQVHHRMEGRPLARVVTPGHPLAVPGAPENPPSLYPDRADPGPAWGMVIDLDACIGCNACMTACQAENNIPVVGRDEVLRGRAMHWLRIDRYISDDDDAGPRVLFQPVPCMHCEKAPCELGCPVNATVHGPDGLNQMIYNRCIGTRTCGAYCPYEVRRFNFFDYAGTETPAMRALRNPDVTVRARGVMEKCTYCVQRISAARRDARAGNRPIREGEVRTACQSACPTDAIVFGDLNDPGSAVAAARRSPRHYAMLAELGTRPRTTYLARVADEAPEGGS